MTPSVCWITATKGRHTCLERNLRFFLDQDYQGKHTALIFNNSEVEQTLDNVELPDNKKIILVNGGSDYTSLGQVYQAALSHIPYNIDLVTFADDDDIFIPSHICMGVDGYKRGGKRAYKPGNSFYRNGGMFLVNNTLEPSIFLEKSALDESGFYLTTTTQHLKWVEHLLQNNGLFVDPSGTPTMCYNWGDVDIPTYKTSGNADLESSFRQYAEYSKEHGDCIITPASHESVKPLYDLFY